RKSGGAGALMSRERNWLKPREPVYVTLALVPFRNSRSTLTLYCRNAGMTRPGANTTRCDGCAARDNPVESGAGYPGLLMVYRWMWSPSYLMMSWIGFGPLRS